VLTRLSNQQEQAVVMTMMMPAAQTATEQTMRALPTVMRSRSRWGHLLDRGCAVLHTADVLSCDDALFSTTQQHTA
jgi:hypothetical protein